MFQEEDKMETTKRVADSLEPYRQLIDLQKQMIELAQQHKKRKANVPHCARNCWTKWRVSAYRRRWRQGMGWLVAAG